VAEAPARQPDMRSHDSAPPASASLRAKEDRRKSLDTIIASRS
jgi:hypothetical protein